MNKEEQKLVDDFLIEFEKDYKQKSPYPDYFGEITIGDFAMGDLSKPWSGYYDIKKLLMRQMADCQYYWSRLGYTWGHKKPRNAFGWARWYDKKSEHYIVVGWQLDLVKTPEDEFEFRGTYS